MATSYDVTQFSTVDQVQAEISKQEKSQRKAPTARKVNYQVRIDSLREHLSDLVKQSVESRVEEPKVKASKKTGRSRKYVSGFYSLKDQFRQGHRGRPNRTEVVRQLRVLKALPKDHKKQSFRDLEITLREAKKAALEAVK